MADNADESEDVIFAHGFGTITDLEVGPDDGYLYVISLDHGAIYKILPTSDVEEEEEEDSDED